MFTLSYCGLNCIFIKDIINVGNSEIMLRGCSVSFGQSYEVWRSYWWCQIYSFTPHFSPLTVFSRNEINMNDVIFSLGFRGDVVYRNRVRCGKMITVPATNDIESGCMTNDSATQNTNCRGGPCDSLPVVVCREVAQSTTFYVYLTAY